MLKKAIIRLSAFLLLAVGLCMAASAASNKTLENFESYGGKGAAMARKWKVMETGDPVTMQLVAGDSGGYKAKLSWTKTPGGIGWGGVSYAVNADWSAYTALRLTFSGLADTNHGVVVQFTCLQADGVTVTPCNYEVHVTTDGIGDWPLLKDGTLTLKFSDFVVPSWAKGIKDLKNVTTMTLSVLTDKGKSFSVDEIVLVGSGGDVKPTTVPPATTRTTSRPTGTTATGTTVTDSTSSVTSASESTQTSGDVSGSESTTAITSSTASEAPVNSDSSDALGGRGTKEGASAGLIISIIVGVVVLAAGTVLLYLFVFKKKTS